MIAKTEFQAVRRFVRESFASLATDADIVYLKDASCRANDYLVVAVCDFICYDRSMPKAVQERVWNGQVPVRRVSTTGTVRSG